MTVHQLIEQLRTMPQETNVFVECDADYAEIREVYQDEEAVIIFAKF